MFHYACKHYRVGAGRYMGLTRMAQFGATPGHAGRVNVGNSVLNPIYTFNCVHYAVKHHNFLLNLKCLNRKYKKGASRSGAGSLTHVPLT